MNHVHKYNKYLVYVIINLGNDIIGGGTVFNDGVKQKDLVKISHVLKHLHGRMILGPFEICFRDSYFWREHSAVISFIVTKQIIVNLFCCGDRFYNRYINSTIRNKYIYYNGTGVKPKHFLSKALTGKKRRFGYSSRGKILDRDMKKIKEMF